MSDFDMDDVFGKMMGDGDGEDDAVRYQYMPFKDKEELSMDLKRPASEFDILVHTLKDQHAKRVNEELKEMNGRDFINAYMSLMQYVQPKFKTIDLEKPKVKKRELNITRRTLKDS